MFKKLSLRLQRIADEITPGCSFADIGSDHALLPVYVAQHKLVQRAIATELKIVFPCCRRWHWSTSKGGLPS